MPRSGSCSSSSAGSSSSRTRSSSASSCPVRRSPSSAGSRPRWGTCPLAAVLVVVVVAAIVGDTVGFEVGRHLGGRVVQLRAFDRHRDRIDQRAGLPRPARWRRRLPRPLDRVPARRHAGARRDVEDALPDLPRLERRGRHRVGERRGHRRLPRRPVVRPGRDVARSWRSSRRGGGRRRGSRHLAEAAAQRGLPTRVPTRVPQDPRVARLRRVCRRRADAAGRGLGWADGSSSLSDLGPNRRDDLSCSCAGRLSPALPDPSRSTS